MLFFFHNLYKLLTEKTDGRTFRILIIIYHKPAGPQTVPNLSENVVKIGNEKNSFYTWPKDGIVNRLYFA